MCFPEDFKGTGVLSIQVFNHFFGVFLVKSHMPVERRGRGLEGNEVCLGSQSQVERQGWAPSLTDLVADASFPVALLLVMSKLLPITLTIKMNEKKDLGNFSSETDMCVPGESFSP